MNETVLNILIGVVIFLMLALNFYVRARRTGRSPLGRVAGILSDVNRNEKMVENFGSQRKAAKLRTGGWRKNRDRVDFLPQELLMALSRVFEMFDEVNVSIEAAMKFKSTSYLAGIDVTRLKEPIARSKKQLAEWLQANLQNPEYQPKKRRGLFS